MPCATIILSIVLGFGGLLALLSGVVIHQRAKAPEASGGLE